MLFELNNPIMGVRVQDSWLRCLQRVLHEKLRSGDTSVEGCTRSSKKRQTVSYNLHYVA